jgi:hypothetical protein
MQRRDVLSGLSGLGVMSLPGTARAIQSSFGPLGTVEINNAKEAVIGPDSETAFVAAGSGFATVDVSDPTDPTVLAERRDLLAGRENGPMVDILDIKVEGDRLLVPGPGNSQENDVFTGFVLYDVSDPAEPEQVAVHEAGGPIHNAFLTDETAYLTEGPSIAIVDVTADDPTEAGKFSVTDFDGKWSDINVFLRNPHDVWVQDETAYVPMWDAGTWIVDVSDPSAAEPLGHVQARPFDELAAVQFDETQEESQQLPGNHHYAQPSRNGRLLAIGKESWDFSRTDDTGGPGGIELWDISTPDAPIKLSEIPPPRADDETRSGTWTTSHNFDLVGDRLYTSWYQGGVKIYDISRPSNPEELAWWRKPDVGAFWTAKRATEDFFIASSVGDFVSPVVSEALFTFPTAPGEQADPPETLHESGTPSGFATPRPTPTPTPTPSPTPSPTPGPTAGESTPQTDSEGQPGFDVLGALTGIAGAWWMLKRGDGE